MSYNRFKTPRAYVDLLSYLLTTGWRTLDNYALIQDDGSTAVTLDAGIKANMFDLKPHTFAQIAHDTKRFYLNIDTGFGSDSLAETSFLAILNHNMHDADVSFNVKVDDDVNFASATIVTTSGLHDKIINAEQNVDDQTTHIHPSNNGWTLITWNTATSDNRYMRITFSERSSSSQNFDEDLIIGGILFGEYFDFPNSPDLGINTDIIYDNVSLQRSIGGGEFANATNLGQPDWNHTTPWALSTTSNQQTYGFNKRHGRMRHSMNFSYLTDTDVFAESAGSFEGTYGKWFDSTNIHNSFFNKVVGQHTPFLFSIDSTSSEVGDYGLFRVGQDTFFTEQVAHKIYNTSLDLIETW
ncbi:MAG: hypothetical protein Unbinned3325contig1000_31 [Prokaryotic dsDNA virus sp.]|nr:MAG: hypothetical protein Unbinned3325contig1000_31 [Prokaryotic dsDNA virus sp.]|tara:strand:+ start:7581 stop:8642 length:1062 start_codon:yes stop_codon:yes gene_type:complete